LVTSEALIKWGTTYQHECVARL